MHRYRFHIGGIHLHCSGLGQHLDRQDETAEILLPYQKAFQAKQRASNDANSFAAAKKWVRLNASWITEGVLNRGNLLIRDDRHAFSKSQQHVNARRA